ncbi:prefoldin subunit 1-like [Mizuhopecten yessoensis]|uniref:Prefoldin subunit 1 n=1 Tax=Mizuhopecten yessoensis TaxID=6573 RepID=A0A210QEI5_MIZYE|nr:prefoldin subunit 1-like [Mizuhopecten yessoensis]OWF47143.1 Prefoldin subunit 1 [Mizuhopecten yessoensis]
MAKGTLPVDMELRKAFQELQSKMITTTQQIKLSNAQIDTLKRTVQHSKLVDQEVISLPPNTRTYEGVGRMFILQSVLDIQKNLQLKVKASEEKMKSLETNKVYLEKNLKESQNNLRELIVSKQQLR